MEDDQPDPLAPWRLSADGSRARESSLGFLAGWPGVAVVVGLVLVLAASFLVVGRSTSSGSPAADGPAGTSIVIGAPRAPGEPVSPTRRCSNPADAKAPLEGKEIKIGSSFAQSGTYSAHADISKGWTAYFETQNTRGGVKGKQIKVVVKDDKYDPATTKANVQDLVEGDGVFALFNIVGEPNNLSLRADLNRSCVPDLFAASGAASMGNPARYPWLIGSMPTPGVEAASFAAHLRRVRPEAKVGILRQNDEFGAQYADSLRKATVGTGLTVVSEQMYDMGQGTVTSQMAKLHAAGADALLLAVNAATCPSAVKAMRSAPPWSPITYLVTPCATKLLLGIAGPAAEGVLSALWVKDPNDPRWADDEAMLAYKGDGSARGLTDEQLADPAVAYGWTMGELLVRTIEASPTLSREDVMATAFKLEDLAPGLLLPGITVNTDGDKDPYPIEQLAIGRWNGTHFEQQGGVETFEGRSRHL